MPSDAAPRPIALAVWSVLLLFLQSVFLFRHVPPGYQPNLYLLFALFLGVQFNSTLSLVIPFLLGLCHDALTFSPLGLTALVLLVVGYLPHTGRPDVYLEGTFTRWILVAAGTFVAVMLRLLVLLALGKDVSSPWRGLVSLLFLHSVFFYPLFAIWTRHIVRRKDQGG